MGSNGRSRSEKLIESMRRRAPVHGPSYEDLQRHNEELQRRCEALQGRLNMLRDETGLPLVSLVERVQELEPVGEVQVTPEAGGEDEPPYPKFPEE